MRLRPIRATDLPDLDWLPAVAKKAGFEGWSSPDALAAALSPEGNASGQSEGQASAWPVACIDEDGPQGLIAYAIDVPVAGAAQVRFLAVDPSCWRLGIGGRAALALERRLKRSAERVYVSVPSRLGLTLYFWLRLGYRPLTQRDWPVAPEDAPSVWMMRELS